MRPVLQSGRGGTTDAVRVAGRGAQPPAGPIRRTEPAPAKTRQSRACGVMFTEVAGHHHHFTSHAGHPAFPTRAVPFILHHVQRHRWLFGGLLCLMVGAASCAIAVQYAFRLWATPWRDSAPIPAGG